MRLNSKFENVIGLDQLVVGVAAVLMQLHLNILS